ncbi:MAG: Na+/H+ antiporter NhaC family protein [Planctomycetota bacterium]
MPNLARSLHHSKATLFLTLLVALLAALTITSAVTAQPQGDGQPEENTQTADPTNQENTEDDQAPPEDAADEEMTPVDADTDAATGETVTGETVTAEPRDPASYRYWSFSPALVAIFLAIVTRQVVPALVIGLIVGAFMMLPCQPAGAPFGMDRPILNGFRLAFEHYLMAALYNPKDGFARIMIIVFTLVIGFMVGVIGKNGGTAGIVKLVAGESRSRRRGALTAWLAGLVVFFDDYANTMIVGPTMRSVFDKMRISRAKLAYIVDSTAAPVASIALIGTWVGAEIGYIQSGIDQVSRGGTPEILIGADGTTMTGLSLFIQSLPYRFYPILALFLVFVIALFQRDFGPMKRAEEKAQAGTEDTTDAPATAMDENPPQPRVLLGVLPILTLVGTTIGVLTLDGLQKAGGWAAIDPSLPMWERMSRVIGGADPYLCIFYGAISSAFVAVLLTLISRACNTRSAIDAGMEGMARMFPAIVILVLATAISSVETDLQLGETAKDYLVNFGFAVQFMPLAIFLTSAVVSFATGSSWATMGLICPVAVTATIGLATSAGLEAEQARVLLFSAVGAVLAGSIFGDHCSPISDTTVLSSLAAGCRHEDHVWTQLPYALLTAVVAIGAGEIACGVYKQPWYIGLGAGAIFLMLFMIAFGRRTKATSVLTKTPLVSDSVRSQVIAARLSRGRRPLSAGSEELEEDEG